MEVRRYGSCLVPVISSICPGQPLQGRVRKTYREGRFGFLH
jgi:hypothetical protein